MTIDEIGYIEELRQRLGLNEEDWSKDAYIEGMAPFDRVGLLCGWFLGSNSWADTFKGYCESQGVYLTTNPDADGVF